MNAYVFGSRNACKMNSGLNCLVPPALSRRRVSRSQVLSASVRNVAFSGICKKLRVKQSCTDSDVETTDVIHAEEEKHCDDDCH